MGSNTSKNLVEECLSAQTLLMSIMKKIFEEFKEWMIVMLDNISVLVHDYENAYKELKLVQGRVDKKNVVL